MSDRLTENVLAILALVKHISRERPLFCNESFFRVISGGLAAEINLTLAVRGPRL